LLAKKWHDVKKKFEEELLGKEYEKGFGDTWDA
jgi:hypothetical protein